MSEPFLGEIRMFGFGLIPKGWASCSGQLLPINQNQALFSLLGTTYGGNGTQTFALPDLRDQTPVHVDTTHGTRTLGERGGATTHTLTSAEMPTHTHSASARASATTDAPAGAL